MIFRLEKVEEKVDLVIVLIKCSKCFQVSFGWICPNNREHDSKKAFIKHDKKNN